MISQLEPSLHATDVPPNSRLIRFEIDGGPSYDRMILVTEQDEGRALYLAGWIGKPLSVGLWRHLKDKFYPRAEVVRFERWCRATQSWRMATLRFALAEG